MKAGPSGTLRVAVRDIFAQAPVLLNVKLSGQQSLGQRPIVPYILKFIPQLGGDIIIEVGLSTVFHVLFRISGFGGSYRWPMRVRHMWMSSIVRTLLAVRVKWMKTTSKRQAEKEVINIHSFGTQMIPDIFVHQF
jgi:hypothetical protein